MNHEELTELIRRLENISTNTNDVLKDLRDLSRLRQASRNTGVRLPTAYGGDRTETRTKDKTTMSRKPPNPSKKIAVGDTVKVTEGSSYIGITGRVVKITATQYEIQPENLEKTFRKWKQNVKKIHPKK